MPQRINHQCTQVWQSLIGALPVAMVILDSNGIVQMWNPTTEKILGWNEQEAIGNTLPFIAKELQPVFQGLCQQVLQDKELTGIEIACCKKDGSEIEISFSMSLLNDAQGNSMIAMVIFDITDHQQTKKALEQAEVKYRSIFENAIEGIFQTTPDGYYITANPALAHIYGYETPEALVANLTDVGQQLYVDPRRRLEFVHLMQKDGAVSKFESQVYRWDGDVIWISESARAVRDATGTVLYYEGLVEDITERKRVEADLQQVNEKLETRVKERTQKLRRAIKRLQGEIVKRQQAEERVRNLVEQTNDWVWEIDQNQVLTYVNPRVCEILGYQASEMLGKNMLEFMSSDAATRFLTVLHQSISDEEPFKDFEQTLIHKDGYPVVVEISGLPIFESPKKFGGYRGVARDITERKRAEREIRKALTKEKELSALKSRFVSMTSHEFRTPLSTILLSSELLERYGHQLSELKRKGHFQRIRVAVSHMTQLLNDVLLVGKAEAGRLALNLAPVDLPKFCQELVEDLQYSASNRHILTFVHEGACSYVNLDEKLLRSILSNLLSNAIKYSPKGGKVHFQLSCRYGEVIFQVSDQGIGIPVKDQEQLFESFYRASNVGTIAGSGLGLAIIKRCVDLHGGQIRVASEVGVGTTFTVSLPVQP